MSHEMLVKWEMEEEKRKKDAEETKKLIQKIREDDMELKKIAREMEEAAKRAEEMANRQSVVPKWICYPALTLMALFQILRLAALLCS